MASRSRDLLEPEEVRRLMEACGSSPSGVRNRALIALMSATGLRLAESLVLVIPDIDVSSRRVHLAGRHMWMHPEAVPHLRRWFRRRNRVEVPGDLCFSSMSGRRLSQSYVRALLPELAERAGVQKRVYSDGFRHTFAARSFRAGVNIRSLQVQFGHENISATVDYLERMGLHSGFHELDRALT